MEKLKMRSPNLTEENIEKIAKLFPNCVTEISDNNGLLKKVIDFDLLKQELVDKIVEGPQERYHLNWPGKREALLTANAPIAKTLRPCRDESVDFDTTKNLFIEGDNLDALKLLQETYLGKVKMIYIDPPYNTGNDFIYEDDFAEDSDEYLKKSNQKDEEGNRLVANTESNGRFHSDWLSMMYPRLKLARNLLRDDGLLVIHIDEHEYPNLEKLLSEIYGESNNLGTIVWDKRNPKGDATGVAQQHELISIYCKNSEYFKTVFEFKRPKENARRMIDKVNQLIREAGCVNSEIRQQYKEWLDRQDVSGGEKAYNLIDEAGEIYRPVSMAWPNKKKAPPDYFIPLMHPVTGKECPIPARGWRNPSSTMKELIKKNLILFGADESTQPTRKYILKENMYENIPSLLYFGGSDDDLLSGLSIYFDNPKPVQLSRKLINSICKHEDIILDFFCGSATTAHAVMRLNAEDGGNRKFIMVQLPEVCEEKSEAYKAGYKTIAEISKERIRRAGKKIKDELVMRKDVEKDKGGRIKEENLLFEDSEIRPSSVNSHPLDIGFRVLKVDTSNMQDVYYTPDEVNKEVLFNTADNIKSNRSSEDLLIQVLLDWGVDLTLPISIEIVNGNEVFFVDGNALAGCFVRGGEITDEFCRELAKYKPLRVVFCYSGFKDDSARINVEQIFKLLSPHTEIKTI